MADMRGPRYYGLRVMSDYRDVDMSVLPSRNEAISLHEDYALDLEGTVVLKIAVERSCTLTINVSGVLIAMIDIDICPGAALTIVQRGDVPVAARMTRTVLLAEGSSVTDVTTAVVRGKMDFSTRVFHQGKSSSRLLAKFVVEGEGRLIARGSVIMTELADGSDGFERIDALLLDERTAADVLPTMTVATDDVRCKHAATVGSIDPEQLFYLMSRGLSEREAKQLFAQGFLEEVCVYGRP